MAVATADLLALLPVVAICTVLEIGLSMILAGRVAIRALHAEARCVGLMRERDLVERNGPLLHPDMAERGAGHGGLEFLWLMAFIHGCPGLLGLVVGHVEELDRVLDVVDPVAQTDVAIIVTRLIQEGRRPLEISRSSLSLLRVVKKLLHVEDALVGLVLHLSQEGLPVFQGLIETFPMTVNARLSNGLFFILRGMKGGLARFLGSMAGNAVHIRCKHETGGVRNPNTSYASIKLLGSHMDIPVMTLVAVGRGMGNRGNLADLMPQRCMARDTLDLVISDMHLVEGRGAIFRDKNLGFVMAFKALSLRHMGIPLNHAHMALLAGDPSCNVLAMIEIPAFDIDIPFGGNVAGGATPNRTGDAVFLSFGPGLVVVADKTVDLVNRQVGPLNNLGMAGGTAELHPPPEFLEVFAVGKGDVLVDHVSLEVFRLVTSLLEAGSVADLRVGLRRFLSRDEVGEGNLSVDPFPFEMVEKPGLVMALGASNAFMAGGLPGIDVGIHLMAEAAEGGGLREFKQGHRDDEKNNDTEDQEDLDPLFVFLGSPLGLSEEIDPEVLD
jgi:hypothetical protein